MLLSIFNTQSTDIWHDPLVLAVIGVIATLVAGLIGAFVTYWIYHKQRAKKEITYQIISDASVASVSPDMVNRIEIRFDKQRVNGLRLLVLKLWNSGNSSVIPEDYLEPITFQLGRRSILSADIQYTEPENLFNTKDIKTFLTLELIDIESEYEAYEEDFPIMSSKRFRLPQFFLNRKFSHQKANYSQPNAIRLTPFLFKPSEMMTLKVIYEGYYKANITGKARIVDGELKEYFIPRFDKEIRISFGIYSLIISVIFGSALRFFNPTGSEIEFYVSIFLFVISLLTGFFFVVFLLRIVILSITSEIKKQSILLKW